MYVCEWEFGKCIVHLSSFNAYITVWSYIRQSSLYKFLIPWIYCKTRCSKLWKTDLLEENLQIWINPPTELKNVYLGQPFSVELFSVEPFAVEPFAVWIVQSGFQWGRWSSHDWLVVKGRFRPPHPVIGWITASWPSLKNNKRAPSLLPRS